MPEGNVCDQGISHLQQNSILLRLNKIIELLNVYSCSEGQVFDFQIVHKAHFTLTLRAYLLEYEPLQTIQLPD